MEGCHCSRDPYSCIIYFFKEFRPSVLLGFALLKNGILCIVCDYGMTLVLQEGGGCAVERLSLITLVGFTPAKRHPFLIVVIR